MSLRIPDITRRGGAMDRAAQTETSAKRDERAAAERLFAGDGAARALARTIDWAATPLGPVDAWPQTLKTAVDVCLGSHFPTALLWGRDRVLIHNDPHIPLLGARFPRAMGRPAPEALSDTWHVLRPLVERTLTADGAPNPLDITVTFDRGEGPRPGHLTVSVSAVHDESGSPAGAMIAAVDMTARVLAETTAAREKRRAEGIIERMGDAHCVLDRDFRIERVNAATERVLGVPRAALLGRSHWDAFPASIDAPVGRAFRRVIAERIEQHFTHHYTGEGYDLYLEVDAYPTEDGGLAMFWRDVTERVRAEAALRESEQRYRTLVENVRDYSIYLLDPEGVIIESAAAAERVTGYAASEVVGKHVAIFYPPDDVADGGPARDREAAAATGRLEREGWRVRKNGERFLADEITTAVRDVDGRLTGFTRISRDLTDRRAAEAIAESARVVGARDQLRRRILEVEEGERRRLARELHDEAGQHLTALGLGLQVLSDVVTPGSEADRRAAQLRAIVGTMSRDLHDLAVRLRPKALDDFGLERALVAYADEWSRQTAVVMDVHAAPDPERLPVAVESAVYRIVQEALTNIAKHSGATRASVVVERRDHQVVAIIEDNGRGFDVAAQERSPAVVLGDHGGLGLLGIHERAELLGGTVEIESSPENGTTIFARIPIDVPASGRLGADGAREHHRSDETDRRRDVKGQRGRNAPQ